MGFRDDYVNMGVKYFCQASGRNLYSLVFQSRWRRSPSLPQKQWNRRRGSPPPSPRPRLLQANHRRRNERGSSDSRTSRAPGRHTETGLQLCLDGQFDNGSISVFCISLPNLKTICHFAVLIGLPEAESEHGTSPVSAPCQDYFYTVTLVVCTRLNLATWTFQAAVHRTGVNGSMSAGSVNLGVKNPCSVHWGWGWG